MKQHEHELQVTRMNNLNQQLVEVRQCDSTALESKDTIFAFFISPGKQELGEKIMW